MGRFSNVAGKLASLDRRYIFLTMFLAVALPFFIPISFRATPHEDTIQFDQTLVRAMESGKPLLIDVDFGPQTMAEMEPMLMSVLHRVFSGDARVIFITFQTEAAAPLRTYLSRMAEQYDLEYGVDYVFLGYASAYAYTMYGMGSSISSYFHEDDRGTPIGDIPIMEGVKNLHDVSAVVNIASNAFPKFWIQYAVAPHDIDFLAGTTAVQATEYYPYLQTGQLKGLLGGGRAAAEYETLLFDKKVVSRTGDATRGLGSQSLALFAILGFIILGNAGYFLSRKKDGGKGR